MADESTIVTPAPAAPVAPTVPETPVVAPVPAGDTPRDEKGRFTAAKIREAAGLPPETAPVAAPIVPASATVETPTAPIASSIEDDLKAIESVPLAATHVAPETPAPTPVAPAAHVLPSTPEAIQLQQWQANPDHARDVVSAVYNYKMLDSALNKGDMDAVVGMLSPAAQQALTEHIYRQNAEKFAQRFADEANGVQQDPRIAQVQQQLQALQQKLDQREQQALTQTQEQQQQAQLVNAANAIDSYVNQLFDAVKMKDSPARPFLLADIQRRIQANPEALSALRGGQLGHVRSAFQDTWKAWKAVAPPTVTPAPPAPAPSAQLMSAPQGTVSTQAPSADEHIKDGHLTAGWWAAQKSRLKAMVG